MQRCCLARRGRTAASQRRGAASRPRFYEHTSIERDGAAWRADGALTLRGETETTPLIFEIEGDAAHAWGEAIVLRERFGVGAETGAGMAASEVQVTFDIWAARGE